MKEAVVKTCEEEFCGGFNQSGANDGGKVRQKVLYFLRNNTVTLGRHCMKKSDQKGGK